MLEKKCPYCKKVMKNNVKSYRYFQKSFTLGVLKKVPDEYGDLPKDLPDNLLITSYECDCKRDELGHNRLYVNGKLYLYHNGKWHDSRKVKIVFVFR